MARQDRKVHVNLSVPESVDSFFESMRFKNIQINGKTITIKKDKSSVYLMALEYSLENAEKWLKPKDD